MTTNVLTTLLTHIDRLSVQDLLCLDDENIAWLPRLGILRPETAIQEIRRVLGAACSVRECLERIAWFQCWLMQKKRIRPWLLYRLGASVLQADYPSLLELLATVLPPTGYRMTIQVRYRAGTYYACMINSDPYPSRVGHVLMCLVLWRGQCFAAAYVGRERHQRNLADALHVALNGETVELLGGLHADLDAAFRMGCRGLSRPVTYRRAAERRPGVSNFGPQQQYDNAPGRHRGRVPDT